MSRLNEIKVFKPHSKQADFTIRAMTPEGASKKLGELMNINAAKVAGDAFKTLKNIEGASHLTFHALNRRIKVQLAA